MALPKRRSELEVARRGLVPLSVEERRLTSHFLHEPIGILQPYANTQRIEAVFFNGNFYDRAALDRITHHVERQARSWMAGCMIIWRFLKNPAAY